jgi:tRNA threonylcarbamoyladenosine biosynthesis protein TsaB
MTIVAQGAAVKPPAAPDLCRNRTTIRCLRGITKRSFVLSSMPSFRQLLAVHPQILVLDAASARAQVGIVSESGERWASSDEEAGIGLFRNLESLHIDIGEVNAFAFCDGPGSILGIRTAAMTLRAWNTLRPRPVYAYCSLALISSSLTDPNVTVIADARRDSWHTYPQGGPLARVPTANLTGALVTPDLFRAWSALPPQGAQPTPYVVSTLLRDTIDANLFTSTEHPDAFLHEEPSYVKWTPQIHRAPTSV